MQQVVSFDPCAMTHVDVRACMSSIEVSAFIVMAALILLGFAPTVLGRLFKLLGWNAEEAEAFSVDAKHERSYLSVLGALTFAALMWAATPIETFQESPFNNPVVRVLGEFSALGQVAAQSLALGAVVGGGLLALFLLIHGFGISAENRNGSHIPLWAGLVCAACPLMVGFVAAAIAILFGGIESVATIKDLLVRSW